MKPVMPKPSPQLILSAAASVLAMASFALGVPVSGDRSAGAFASPMTAGFELPAAPSLPTLLPR